jgi:hypothetical protein
MEIFRAIPSLAWDSIVFGCRRLSDLIYKVFKVRLWKGLDAYQYLNT